MDKDSVWAWKPALAWALADSVKGLFEASDQTMELNLDIELARNSFKIQDWEMQMSILDLARNQRESASDLLAALQKLSDAQAGFVSAVAEGERLLVEREDFRTDSAARIAASRYNDMAFRIFRNNALRR